MFLFVFALLIVGVPCLDILAAGTFNGEVEIGTSTSLHNPDSQLGHWLPTSSTIITQSIISLDSSHTNHWLPTSSTITQTTISLNASYATSDAGGASTRASSPALIATELSTQTITKTISRISLVTVTAKLYTPLSGALPPVTPSPETNLFGTAPPRSTQNSTVSFRSFKMGTPPIPSPVISTSRGKSSTVSFKTGTPLIPSPTISAGLRNNAVVQQVWPSVAIVVVALGFSYL